MNTSEVRDSKSELIPLAVSYNGIASNITLHQSSIVVVPTAPRTVVAAVGKAGDALGYVLPYNSVQQVLVSRKRPCQVRVVIETSDSTEGTPPVDILFESTPDRDRFMAALAAATSDGKSAQDNNVSHGNADATTQLLHDAIPMSSGLLGSSTSELDSVAVQNEIRGAVHVFEAINALIDVATLTLRPVSEQLEMDILRQLPILAEVFLRRVRSEEDHRNFWEAVVKKFFCFTKSYLDLDFSKVSTAAASISSTMAGQVNRAGVAALPTAHNFTAEDQPYDVPDITATLKSKHHPNAHQAMFIKQTQKIPSKRPRSDDAQVELKPTPDKVCHDLAEATPPPLIAFLVPPQARAPETIKLLKQFWAASTNGQDTASQAQGLSAQLLSLAKGSVLHRCVLAALEHCGQSQL